MLASLTPLSEGSLVMSGVNEVPTTVAGRPRLGGSWRNFRVLASMLTILTASACAETGKTLDTGNGRLYEVLVLKHEPNQARGSYARYREQLRLRYVTKVADSATLAFNAEGIFRSLVGFAVTTADSMVVIESARPVVVRWIPWYVLISARFVRQPDGSWLELGV